jgi:chromosome segregation ATPase
MYLTSLELTGFKSFGKKSVLEFSTPITAIVGPNGSGKSNTAEAFRFVLGEQSMKGLRSKRGEDLIWGGSGEVPRSNRASVKATFNNSKRLLNIDFDEVVLERIVYRDGTNEYYINGSKVRLKDIIEILAGANIGSSGYHIISQGEADRVLAASMKERKQMIEDALGLRVYHYKKEESIKKLARTQENRAQVESLRKENAPHLKFLERQMKKLERARELRGRLIEAYQEFLKREEDYLGYESENLAGLRTEPSQALADTVKRIGVLRKELERAEGDTRERTELLELESTLSSLRKEHADLTRTSGRIEGQLAYEERRLEEEKQKALEQEGLPIPYKEARTFWEELTNILDHAHSNGDPQPLRDSLRSAQSLLRKFIERHKVDAPSYEPDLTTRERLQTDMARAGSEILRVEGEMESCEQQINDLKRAVEENKDANREQERELFTLIARESELRGTLRELDTRTTGLAREKEEFEREIREGIALIGRHVMGYKDVDLSSKTMVDLDGDGVEDRSAQLERKRDLEKMKIRLEEMGGASADDITKEYEDVKERDEFLERELTDLDASAQSLRELIENLERELDERFAAGVATISKQFHEFFTLMFGGGNARLVVTQEKKRGKLITALFGDGLPEEGEEETDGSTEQGVDIEVSLPRKRVQNLMMLSGGERALTSIALIFAISQVNPPPFLILDETDAALDEANSRRYGDMIETLARSSQLILITHNRETMSRAGVLYGVTMGADGVSRILSVKFEEATTVAK